MKEPRKPSKVVRVIAETQFRLDGHREKLAAAEPWLRNQYLKNAKKVARALDEAGVLPVSRETSPGYVVTTDGLGLVPGSPYPPSLLISRLTEGR